MSVLRYYGCTDLCFRIFGSVGCIIVTFYLLCLVLCCDIYRSTLISIMYPACMITVHGRKSRALHHALGLSVQRRERERERERDEGGMSEGESITVQGVEAIL